MNEMQKIKVLIVDDSAIVGDDYAVFSVTTPKFRGG
jgi:hypothetical protein